MCLPGNVLSIVRITSIPRFNFSNLSAREGYRIVSKDSILCFCLGTEFILVVVFIAVFLCVAKFISFIYCFCYSRCTQLFFQMNTTFS